MAHIFGVKPDSRSASSISHKERIARFIRNIHPANHFYIPDRPKGRGKLYGEDIQVIQYMAMRNRQRYSRIWTEFLDLALAKTRVQALITLAARSFKSEGSTTLEMPSSECRRMGQLCQLRNRSLSDDWPRRTARRVPGLDRNDESGRQHRKFLSYPSDVRLHWKTSKNAQPKLIGFYRLDLISTLPKGHFGRTVRQLDDEMRSLGQRLDGGIHSIVAPNR